VIISDVNAPATALDAAVHVFYELSREQLLAAVDDLVAARHAASGDDDLGPLAPNPLLVRDGLDGAYAHSLATIITKYAGPPKLVRFTSFMLEAFNAAVPVANVPQFWLMHGHLVDGANVTPIVIPTLIDNAVEMSLDLSTTTPLVSRVNPTLTAPDDISVLINMDAATAATAAARQAALDAALRIENPRHHTPDTIDCTSCHVAQPAIELVGSPLGLSATGDPNAFTPDPSIRAADLVPTTQLVGADGGLNIHAFSYRGRDPMINQRVINETAANLALVNHLRR
jgi:hypothetical protein